MHTIFTKNDKIFCFGRNDHGQLGLGHNIDQYQPVMLMQQIDIKQIVCGGTHSIILKNNNDILIFPMQFTR